MLDFLRPAAPISKSFLAMPRISGIMCGIWPQAQHSFGRFILFAFSVCVVAVGAFGENLYGFIYIKDLVDALEAFCPGVTKLICVVKMLVLFMYNRQWFDILQRLRNIIMAEQHDREKIKIVQQLASVSNILSFLLLTSGTLTNLFFNLRPLLANLIRYFSGEELVHVLPFKLILPEIFVRFPLFPLTFAILTLSGVMTVFTFSCVDGLFVCACMTMCGVFGMIQYDIRILFAVLSESETSTLAQNKRFHHQLGKIVERHNAIIDLCTDFTENFALIILLHFLSAALVLCLSLLDLMLNTASLGLLLYMFYSVAASTQLFLYCIGGNYISDSSIAVADTLYDIEWYKCDTVTKKMILMMMRRSQKATRILVPFFAPSLPAFSAMISKAGSYIALLKTFL